MALVSPGIAISINDQSQYVNSNVGSVPLVVLATAQDKTYNGVVATGTTKANAGKLLSFNSQRDLITQMGTPIFQLSSAGTPVNGSEINEYGLLAAYSSLGLSNRLYAIRADIDLNHLIGTSIRPLGNPADGTYWLNTKDTSWGIEVLNQATNTFTAVKPLIIKDSAQVYNQNITNPLNGFVTNDVPTPIGSVGAIGSYALVFVNTDGTTASNIRLFYKKSADSYQSLVPSNTWVEVGSMDWQASLPALIGTQSNPVIQTNSKLIINGVEVISDNTATALGGANGLAAKINNAVIPGVFANVSSTGHLQLFATSAATGYTGIYSPGPSRLANGKLVITDEDHSPLFASGLVTANSAGTNTAYCPILFYSDYSQAPSSGWYTYPGSIGRPTGSIWWKQGAIGGGFSPTFSKYNASLGQFKNLTVGFYQNFASAIYALDPVGGGTNIPHGAVISTYGVPDATYNSLRYYVQGVGTQTVATGGAPSSFVNNDSFIIKATAPGSNSFVSYTCTVLGTTAIDFVNAILAGDPVKGPIPYVTAQINSSGTISIIHSSGGNIQLQNVVGTPLTSAGFISGQGNGFIVGQTTGYVYAFLWKDITGIINYQENQPYSVPRTGTLWYDSNHTDVDIMINENGWKGYRRVGLDVHGYVLTATDPMGVIVTPGTPPTSQSTGASVVPGDLWLDSGDLQNYPALYRCTKVIGGTPTWTEINNTDHITQNGIIFADARWDGFANDTGGKTDVITDALPSVANLLNSNYTDLDAPDYRLYPRGTLLFNTRRSGYNVKRFVPDYFNSTSFPNGSLPTVKNTWVTASGLDANGVMYSGSHAQRSLIVSAMQSAIDSNLDILSPTYQFNLIVAPNYPELIPNMLTLNDNRGDTAFVIGDTPMDLAPNTVNITNWVNNTNGNGLPIDASTSPYLALYYPAGRTNDLAGNQVVVPPSHAVLRTFLYSDNVSYPWFAPAGLNRGRVTNLSDVGYINNATGGFVHNSISQGLRDALFTLGINPITQLPGSGLVVFGQLTRSGNTTARNRVNVARLENYLRTIFTSVSNGYLFEPNDGVTRKSIATQIEGALNNVLAHRGLYDFLVICDTSNNTPATISNNQLYVDIAIEPERDVEFIYIPIAIYNPGSIAQLNTTST
jgi:hypothetical protein